MVTPCDLVVIILSDTHLYVRGRPRVAGPGPEFGLAVQAGGNCLEGHATSGAVWPAETFDFPDDLGYHFGIGLPAFTFSGLYPLGFASLPELLNQETFFQFGGEALELDHALYNFHFRSWFGS